MRVAADIPSVPPLRGLLATLGASVSLVAAGVLGLLAISAVIALEGWPGLGGRFDDVSTAQLSAPSGEPGGQEEGGTLVLAQVSPEQEEEPEEPVDVGTPPPDDSAPSGTITVPSPPTPTPSPTPQPVPAPAPEPVDSDPSPDADADGGEAVGDVQLEEPLCELTGVTNGVLSGTGQALSPVTGALLPGSGETVEGVTGGLGDGAQSTACSLGSTVDRLLGGGR